MPIVLLPFVGTRRLTDRSTDLLAPLTSVTDLPSHPTLSRPFTSSALTDLASQGCDLMHKENAALSKVRPLLTKLTGDHTWADCDMFLGPNDSELFEDGLMSRILKRKRMESQADGEDGPAAKKVNGGGGAQPATNGGSSQAPNGDGPNHQQQKTGNEDFAMADGDAEAVENLAGEHQDTMDEPNAAAPPPLSENEAAPPEQNGSTAANGEKLDNDEVKSTNGDAEPPNTLKTKGKEPEILIPNPGGKDVVMTDGDGGVGLDPNNRPAQTNDDEAASLLASLLDESFIHPIFLAPKSAHPDRDLGLPEQEAEDVRRLLQLYVQKQEEVCRGVRKLYEGLLNADRRRKTVLAWSKAEAHCGQHRDMSDGEDWYDKEEWGLSEDLEKGKDEEEEDTTQTQKKTRNRIRTK